MLAPARETVHFVFQRGNRVSHMPEFANYTDAELLRIDVKLWDRFARGYDWPTLRVSRPHAYRVIRRVRLELYLRTL